MKRRSRRTNLRPLLVPCGSVVLVLISTLAQPASAIGLLAPPAEPAAGGASLAPGVGGAAPGVGGAATSVGGAPTPNWPRGATSIDQSAYAMGTMSWNVIFLESNGEIDANLENWTSDEISNIQNEISEAKAYWEGLTAGFHPNARLSIDVHYENGGVPLGTRYEPITRSSTQDSLWINDAMNALGYTSGSHFVNVRDYNNDRRTADGNHWATTIFIVDDTVDPDNRFSNNHFAYAYINGPYTLLTQGNNGWGSSNFGMVLAHEMGHIFGGLDEYPESGIRNTRRAGYLNGLTLNASLDGSGNPVTPPQPNSLMVNIGNFSTGVPYSPHSSTSVNFGHRDSDGDTIPDILDTFPTLIGDDSLSNPAAGKFAFTGSISVNDYPNANPINIGFSNSRSDMTINTIASMAYVLDAGSPVPFPASDGAYDDYTEALSFSILDLAPGLHTIDVYGTNSVGNMSNVLQFTFTSLAPEPGSLLLAAIGALGLGRLRRRHC